MSLSKDELSTLFRGDVELSESFLRDHIGVIDWDVFLCHRDCSEGFLREYLPRCCWKSVSMQKHLSLPFIREYASQLHWDILDSSYFSESFCDEFASYVVWGDIYFEDYSYPFQLRHLSRCNEWQFYKNLLLDEQNCVVLGDFLERDFDVSEDSEELSERELALLEYLSIPENLAQIELECGL